jgi:putative tricarboxylic transport membrane protein
LAYGPLILSFILGPMLESNLRKGMTYTDEGFWPFLTRPISGLLLALAVLSVLWPYAAPYLRRRRPGG